MRDAQIKRAARKAGCQFNSRKTQDDLIHFRFSLSDSGPLRKHRVCAHWAMKAKESSTALSIFGILAGVCEVAANRGNSPRPCGTPLKFRRILWGTLGEKNPPNFFTGSCVCGWSLSFAPGQHQTWQFAANTTCWTSEGGAASVPGTLSATAHARFVYPVCVLRASHCRECIGCLPWSLCPPVAGWLRSSLNSRLP